MSGYQALRESAAWLDLEARGRFRAGGEDRARLLHAMTTNHIQQMKPGDAVYAFFLNAQGRIVGDANLLCLDEYFLIDTETANHDEVFQHLDRFIIADDVTLEDARTDTFCIGVEGPASAAILAQLTVPIRGDFTMTGAPGARLYGPMAEKAALVEQLAALSVPQATAEEAEAVRLEHHKPRYGADITAKHLVHETQMLHAVHFSKGCYIGQEIVERVRSRGQVHRLLVPLTIAGSEVPAAATPIQAGTEAAGDITSAAFSPALGKVVALGYLRSQFAGPGVALTVAGAAAEVAARGN
jgi:tRNA-modifying protein YgfZ